MSLTRIKCSTEIMLLVVKSVVLGDVGGTSQFTRIILFLYCSHPRESCLFIVDVSIFRTSLTDLNLLADLK